MSDSKHSGLYLRVVSGVILAPLALFALIYGGWPFAFMIGLCISVATYEWLEMARLSKRPALNFIPGFIYILVCFAAIVHVRVGYGQGAGLALALLLSGCATPPPVAAYCSPPSKSCHVRRSSCCWTSYGAERRGSRDW